MLPNAAFKSFRSLSTFRTRLKSGVDIAILFISSVASVGNLEQDEVKTTSWLRLWSRSEGGLLSIITQLWFADWFFRPSINFLFDGSR